jgi:carboxyl-terminal processing protease
MQIKLPILIAIGLAAGILLGTAFSGKDKKDENFMKNIMKFREVMTYIDRAYVDPVNSGELVETAIVKMLENLDPHTIYIPKKDVELSDSDLRGEFEGVGIEFNIFRDTIAVLAPLSGGPSEKVGLMAGDKIVTVDGETVAGIGITNRGVIDRLRGPKGTKVVVGIKRRSNKNLLKFTITRDKIPQYSVDAGYMISDEVGYIKISRFSETTYEEFHDKLASLVDSGMKKLIVDLQGNPGGYMDRAVNISDEMIGGNAMIVSQNGKEPRANAEYRAHIPGLFEDGPLIVLINEGSASGSEIVAGAIQDNDRGLLVGRRSFGKGLVQSLFRLSDGSELRLTIAKYYTPSGRSIQRPYTNGVSEYNKDLKNRYDHGEFFHADSIRFTDSLKFQTKKGRIVYGGGGIMPDYFVPWDTTMNSGYYSALLGTNILREYALKYYEQNKNKLDKMTWDEYYNHFEVDDAMLKNLIEMGEANEIKYKENEFKRSEKMIRIIIKGTIARNIWDREKYFMIINELNEAYEKALTLFDKAEVLLDQ